MDELQRTLVNLRPDGIEEMWWDEGRIHLQVKSYRVVCPAPSTLITSVRGIIVNRGQVLVINEADGGVHVTPGGRREAKEEYEETLRREVLEESGWTIGGIEFLGYVHFYHLTARPKDYLYPYPDFFQLIYIATAKDFQESDRQIGGWEVGAEFVEIEKAMHLQLPVFNQVFLQAISTH